MTITIDAQILEKVTIGRRRRLAVIAIVETLKNQGYKLQEISDYLTLKGYRTTHNTVYSKANVWRILHL